MITRPAIQALRDHPSAGLSRRQLLRRAVGAGVGLWFVEMGAGTIGWLWSAVTAATPRVPVGTYGRGPPAPGRPAHSPTASRPTSPEARAFVMHRRPGPRRLDARGRAGRARGRRRTSAPCRSAARTWAVAPTHAWRTSGSTARATSRATTGSASKAAGERFGPAARGMDRLATSRSTRTGCCRSRPARSRSARCRSPSAQPGAHPAARRERLRLMAAARWLRVYPRWWRDRYAAEMADILAEHPPDRRRPARSPPRCDRCPSARCRVATGRRPDRGPRRRWGLDDGRRRPSSPCRPRRTGPVTCSRPCRWRPSGQRRSPSRRSAWRGARGPPRPSAMELAVLAVVATGIVWTVVVRRRDGWAGRTGRSPLPARRSRPSPSIGLGLDGPACRSPSVRHAAWS